MDEKIDQIKGRTKQTIGTATDDEQLEREGRLDQAGASVKEAADRTVDRIKDTIKG